MHQERMARLTPGYEKAQREFSEAMDNNKATLAMLINVANEIGESTDNSSHFEANILTWVKNKNPELYRQYMQSLGSAAA